MNCRTCQERINQSLEEALSPVEQQLAEAHVRSCAACAQFRTALQRVDRVFSSDGLVPAPPGFSAGVLARVELERQRQRPRQRKLLLALATASFTLSMLLPVAIFAGVVFVLRSNPAASAGLVEALIRLADFGWAMGGGLWTAAGALLEWLAAYPLLPGLLLTSAGLGMLWLYLVWHLGGRESPAKVVTR